MLEIKMREMFWETEIEEDREISVMAYSYRVNIEIQVMSIYTLEIHKKDDS